MAKGSNYTTFLEEMSPHMENQILKTRRQNSDIPANIYIEQRLLSTNCAIRRVHTEPDVFLPLHVHDFLVFAYCRQAEGYEYRVGTNRYRIHTGDLICIPSGVPHQHIRTSEAGHPFIRDELMLRKDFLRSFGKRLPENFFTEIENQYLFSGNDALWEYIDQLFLKGVEETEKKRFRWDTMIDGYALLLLVTIVRAILDTSNKIIPVEEPNLFDKVLSYLKENLDKKLTPEDIAEHFYVSKSTLNRTFHKHMGTSFYDGITKLRLISAQQLIMEGMLLEEVSQKVGFANYPTFYRAFRKEFGISPQQFKQESL